MHKYLSRKFLLALIFTITGCTVFAFTSKLTGGEWIALVGIIMGVFTAGDAAVNLIHKDKRNPDDPTAG
jgi:hypothetical protein